jgi:hypothetical protein
MHDGTVTDRNVISDMYTGLLISPMYDHPILYVHTIADMDAVHVPSHYGIEPNAAVIAHRDIPHDSGIWCDKTILTEAGRLAFNR